MLTGVHLLLRAAGTMFQVYLSRKIGASGIGLLQLVLSVGNLALVTGIAGIRTTAMYLTAEELGKKRPEYVSCVLSGCFLYSILCSGTVSILLYWWSPFIAAHWIQNAMTASALKLFAAFVPVVCLCGVMSGYFTAANRIGTLAAVEIAEQLVTISTTMLALHFWAGEDPERACLCVVFGSSFGTVCTLSLLIILRNKEAAHNNGHIPIRDRLLRTALPLACADLVRSSISTAEHLLVPRRLRIYPGEADPMSAFGRITGMVFPVMMFPACILFALAELLIPEIARCHAAGQKHRIQYLIQKSLWAAMIYGILFGGLLWLLAIPLCTALYKNPQAGESLRAYAFLVPFLYCDSVTDAMTKGLGQQRICVRYNILTSALDIVLLFFLLPRYGLTGFFLSFLISHLLNFLLSIRRLLLISGCRIPFHIPALSVSAGLLSAFIAETARVPLLYIPLLLLTLSLFRIVNRTDILWLRGLITNQKETAVNS